MEYYDDQYSFFGVFLFGLYTFSSHLIWFISKRKKKNLTFFAEIWNLLFTKVHQVNFLQLYIQKNFKKFFIPKKLYREILSSISSFSFSRDLFLHFSVYQKKLFTSQKFIYFHFIYYVNLSNIFLFLFTLVGVWFRCDTRWHVRYFNERVLFDVK